MILYAQTEIPAKPSTIVNDYAGVLSQKELSDLESKAVAFDNKTSTQISIVIMNTLGGRDLVSFSQELAESWGIGQEGKDNGILILLVVKDHHTRIHTGRGITSYASASRLGALQENEMNPFFKKGEYYNGLNNGLSALIQLLDGKYTAAPKKKNHWSTIIGVIIIVLIIIISSTRKRFPPGTGGGFMYMGGFGSRNFGGGGFGGGSGGGGFGGFGGGSFGGGGSSSSW